MVALNNKNNNYNWIQKINNKFCVVWYYYIYIHKDNDNISAVVTPAYHILLLCVEVHTLYNINYIWSWFSYTDKWVYLCVHVYVCV